MEKDIPDRRTLKDHGPYSAYCKVCWRAVYSLWIDEASPEGRCIDGHSQASDCPDALSQAEFSAKLARGRELLATNCGLKAGEIPSLKQFRALYRDGITIYAIAEATGHTVERLQTAMRETGFWKERGWP